MLVQGARGASNRAELERWTEEEAGRLSASINASCNS